MRRADGLVQVIGTPGTLLGVFGAVALTDIRSRMSPGDLLLLYTDGAARRPDRRGPEPRQPMFDDAALNNALPESCDLDALATTEYIAAAVTARHGGWASDDIALLALRVPPAS